MVGGILELVKGLDRYLEKGRGDIKECWSKAHSRLKAPFATHIEELPCCDDRFKGAGGNCGVCTGWKDFKRGWGVQEVLLDDASVSGSHRVGSGRYKLN